MRESLTFSLKTTSHMKTLFLRKNEKTNKVLGFVCREPWKFKGINLSNGINFYVVFKKQIVIFYIFSSIIDPTSIRLKIVTLKITKIVQKLYKTPRNLNIFLKCFQTFYGWKIDN